MRTDLDGYSLVVGANRDEYYDRPTRPPGVLCGAPLVVGGCDERAGGTWLGVGEHKLIAALVNRPDEAPDATRRSRGLLCLDVLRAGDAAAGRNEAERLCAAAPYNSFNLFVADPWEGWVVTYDGAAKTARTLALGPLTILANAAPEDESHPAVKQVGEMLAGFAPTGIAEAFARLKTVCRACELREQDRGTRSSSLIAVGPSAPTLYLHCNCPPTEGEYADLSSWVR